MQRVSALEEKFGKLMYIFTFRTRMNCLNTQAFLFIVFLFNLFPFKKNKKFCHRSFYRGIDVERCAKPRLAVTARRDARGPGVWGRLVPPSQGQSRSSLQAQSGEGRGCRGPWCRSVDSGQHGSHGPAERSTQQERPVLCTVRLQARGLYHLQRCPERRVCSAARLDGLA